MWNENLGYVLTCPSNLGTGLRAGVHVRLPLLSKVLCAKSCMNCLITWKKGFYNPSPQSTANWIVYESFYYRIKWFSIFLIKVLLNESSEWMYSESCMNRSIRESNESTMNIKLLRNESGLLIIKSNDSSLSSDRYCWLNHACIILLWILIRIWF